MKASFVADKGTLQTIYECADIQHDLLKMMPDHNDAEVLIDYLLENAWLIAITEDVELLGYILIEWTDLQEKRALVHICKLNKCNGMKAWEAALPLIEEHVKTLTAYIPEDRIDVLSLAKKAHFKTVHIKERGIYFARKTFKKQSV
jgi:hypothetical protein